MLGKTILHYKILEKLGEGGMGVVYKAEDTKLKRNVAIKFLPKHIAANDEERERFKIEAQAAAALNHPNIATIYTIEEADDEMFIVMEHIDGQELKDIVGAYRNTPLPVDDIVNYATQIADGLQAAHEKGIIHRDIKSSNIMITEKGKIKIMDFGLARIGTGARLTKDQSTLGTAAYMSPEQVKGEKADNRSDIWSFGIVLYEMLTGQLPFKGDYEQATMYSIVNEKQEPIMGLRTGLPGELEYVVDKTLAKNPDERYQHADELSADLKKLYQESEISKKTPSPRAGIQGSSKSRPKRVKIYAGALLFLSVLIIIIYFFADRIFEPAENRTEPIVQSDWENSIAVLPFTDLSPEKDQEYFCDGMTEQIITNLSKIKRLKVIARTSVMTYKNTNKQIPEIGKELNVKNILEGSIRKYGDSIRVTAQLVNTEDGAHLWADDFDRELVHIFEVQDDVSEAIASNLLSTLSIQEITEIKTDRPNDFKNYDLYIRAKDYHRKALVTENPDYLQEAIQLLKEVLNLEPDYLSANIELADAYNTYFNMVAKTDEEKSRYMQLSKEYIDIAYGLNPKSLDVIYIKGMITEDEQGIEYLSKARFVRLTEYLKINPNHPMANLRLGFWLRDYGLVHQSLSCFNKALELDPFHPFNYDARGRSYFLIGEFEKAELDFKKALEIEPGDYSVSYLFYLISFKRIKEAEKLMSQLRDPRPNDNELQRLQSLLYAAKGDEGNALSSFSKTIFKQRWLAPITRAAIYSLLNDKEKAIEFLIEGNREFAGLGRSYYFGLLNSPHLKILHDDPRFKKILAQNKEMYEENLRKYGDIHL